MKVALVHDYLKEYGGAERVLEALHELYPDATVFTTVYLPEYLGPHRERFKRWNIQTSWVQYVPLKAKLISPMRLLAPLLFQQFDFSKFDVVIVSATGAYTPNIIRTKRKVISNKQQEDHMQSAISHKPARNASQSDAGGPVHICYCHTPPRYLYGYATAREWKKNILFKIIGETMNHVLRMVDFTSSKRVDYFIANSQEVKARIQKFYRKDATVIYPPVEISTELRSKNQELRKYYLAGGRLARPKHIDLLVKACSELQLPLKVFGRGFAGYEEELRSSFIARRSATWQSFGFAQDKSQGDSHGRLRRPQNDNPVIEFLGEVSDEEKAVLMSNAKAFLMASEDEDFGITPVEAMSYGTPVIAYKSGGVKETVVDGKTGVFFEELSVESLKKAIKTFEDSKIKAEDCRTQAEKFSKARFIKEIKAFVEKVTR